MDIRYPHIKVRLVGVDGNAFSIIGAVTREMKNHKVSSAEISKFREEALSGDYENLLYTCQKWVMIR